MKKNPINQVKDRFGSKQKLVDELLGLIKRPSDVTKDQFRQRLRSQSNRKLLILMTREQSVKERFGNRDKLIDAIAGAAGGKKDADKSYRKRLAALTTGQLLDLAKRYRVK